MYRYQNEANANLPAHGGENNKMRFFCEMLTSEALKHLLIVILFRM